MQAQTVDRKADAKALFDAGQAALRQGNFRRARELYQQSEALFPAAGTLLNLADCEEKLGLVASARAHYEEAMKLLLSAPPGTERDRIAFALERATEIAPRVPVIQLHLSPGAPGGVSVFLDGTELPASSLDKDLPLDPGKHVVKSTAPGRLEKAYELDMKERESRALTVEVGISSHAPLAEGPRPLRVAGLLTGGLALGGIGVWAVTGILAIDKSDQLHRLCPQPAKCGVEGEALAGEGSQLSTASTVGLITGIGFTAAAVTLLVIDQRRQSPARVAIAPGIGGVTVSGAF